MSAPLVISRKAVSVPNRDENWTSQDELSGYIAR